MKVDSMILMRYTHSTIAAYGSQERAEGVIDLPMDASNEVAVLLQYIYQDRATFVPSGRDYSDSCNEIWFVHVARVYELSERLQVPGEYELSR